MSRILLPLLFILTLSTTAAANKPDAYTGLWWNEEKDGIFELVLNATDGKPTIEGITRWGKDMRYDEHNPDPALRSRTLKDITFLWDFTYVARKNRWKDGKVYDPNNGKTYDAKMELERDGAILKMRGYIGVSFLGRTARFERVTENDLPDALKQSGAAR